MKEGKNPSKKEKKKITRKTTNKSKKKITRKTTNKAKKKITKKITNKAKKKITKKITNKAKKKITRKSKKHMKGGGPRENNFNSSGNFGNMVNQLSNMIENSIAGIIDSVNAVYTAVQLPPEMISIVEKPNEPLPSNTPIARAINII